MTLGHAPFRQVEGIEKEVAELIARGVKFEKYDVPDMDKKGISAAGGAKAAWFKDTKGNVLALIKNSRLLGMVASHLFSKKALAIFKAGRSSTSADAVWPTSLA
jgi:hypothetical protein